MKCFVASLSLAAGIYFAAVPAGLAAPDLPLINTNNVINVTNYGANVTNADNAAKIQSAINAAAAGGGGTVEIPAGTYMCGPLTMGSSVNLQLDAGALLRMLPIDQYPGGDVSPANFISASSMHDLSITGSGAIDGQGLPWWKDSETNSAAIRPNMINFGTCTRVLVQNITCSNSPSPFLVVKGKAGNVTVQHIQIYAPDSALTVNPSHNTDGFDLAETNALITDCIISTGDDNIAIGSSTSTSRDILVTNCTFGVGHGCSIGSFTSGGVANITVINCSFTGTQSGFKVKSQVGRGGLVQNLNYLNLAMTNVDWPISFDAHYEFGLGSHTTLVPAFAAYNALTNSGSLGSPPVIQNILVSNVTATLSSGRPPFQIWGLLQAPVSNVVFRAVSLNSSAPYPPAVYCATNIQLIDCTFNMSGVATNMQFWDAGIIFTNSPGSPAATNLWVLDGLTTNGVGNALQFYNALGLLKNTNAFDDGPLTLAASTFTISNNLSLLPNTVLNFKLGTNTTKLAVAGNLALGGTNYISAGPGFTNGTYTLMTCGGTLNGNYPVLAAVPAGYTCAFNTNTAGQVKLIVTLLAPTNLIAAATNLLINLKWNSVVSATGYNLKRGTVSGTYPTIFSGLTVTNYADANVTNAQNYFYVVTAVSAGGESTNSLPVNAIPLPSKQPANLVAQAVGGQLQLSWPQDHLGWRLQIQTNNLASGLSTNWATVANSTNVQATNLVINPTNRSVFLRLVYP